MVSEMSSLFEISWWIDSISLVLGVALLFLGAWISDPIYNAIRKKIKKWRKHIAE